MYDRLHCSDLCMLTIFSSLLPPGRLADRESISFFDPMSSLPPFPSLSLTEIPIAPSRTFLNMFFFKKKRSSASVAATIVEKKERQPHLPTTRILSDRVLTRAIVEKTPASANDISVPSLSPPMFSIERPLPPLPSHSVSSQESGSTMMGSDVSDRIAPHKQEKSLATVDIHRAEAENHRKQEQGKTDITIATIMKETNYAAKENIISKVPSTEDVSANMATRPLDKGVKNKGNEALVRVEPVKTAVGSGAAAAAAAAEKASAIKQSRMLSPNSHGKGNSTSINSISGIPRRRHPPATAIEAETTTTTTATTTAITTNSIATTTTTITTASAASAKDSLIHKKLGRFSPNNNSLLPVPKSQTSRKDGIVHETPRQCRSGTAYSTRLPIRRTT
ncbi:hypothetical protein BX666DRAFT_1939044 [Dichotomocladium elegans]|nr:hypothetical protein BX666DRAFT_1939044 [Dichotomocladium elegans]